MTTYISILRGINVSGQKIIKMDALRKMYDGLGFQDVRTYLQSGNIVFREERYQQKELETIIFAQLLKTFGFEIPVIVLTEEELREIIGENPYCDDNEKDQSFLHVTFLSSVPKNIHPEDFANKKMEGEDFLISDRAVYLFCPNGYGKTKLTNQLFENKLKVVATTRNWKTTNEL